VTRTFHVVALVLVLAGFGFAAITSPSLPDRVPSHWNDRGEIDDTMPKPWGVYLLPVVMAGTWLLLSWLPRISPRGFDMSSFARAWGVLCVASLAFILFVEVMTLNAARTGAPLMRKPFFAAVGVLIVVLGNFLGKVTRNFFAGIRTPWTLASEEVWLRTHRLAGKLFVLAGIVIFAAALANLPLWWVIAAPVAAVLASAVYSYVIYRRIEGFPARKSA
jgi:uncharacterized membrane protein